MNEWKKLVEDLRKERSKLLDLNIHLDVADIIPFLERAKEIGRTDIQNVRDLRKALEEARRCRECDGTGHKELWTVGNDGRPARLGNATNPCDGCDGTRRDR